MASECAVALNANSCFDACLFPEADLARCDIAALNLAAAYGLPGFDKVDVRACLQRLDEWAERVRVETLRHVYRFDPRSQEPPSEFSYGNSLARFCCYIMLQVLQEDCGVVYNPQRKFNPKFGDPADEFIHGILDKTGSGGTCATMPVVYVAIARRLGYPVRLVETRSHLFFRWVDPRGTLVHWDRPDISFWIPPDRFNVEGAGEGVGFYLDGFYMQWPQLWQDFDFEHGRYLRSMTAREELAGFMIARGECFWDIKNREEAIKAYYFARQLAPEDIRYAWLHEKRSAECAQFLADRRRSIDEASERNRWNMAQREKQRKTPQAPPPRPTTVKVALGSPHPINLPFGTDVRYVMPEEADVLPPVGRPLRVACGGSLPSNLPAGTAYQYVDPAFADPLPTVFPKQHDPWAKNLAKANAEAAAFEEQQQERREMHKRLRDESAIEQAERAMRPYMGG